MQNLSDSECGHKPSGIRKIASFDFSEVRECKVGSENIKTASSKDIDGSSEADSVLKQEIAKRPNALFFKARAIEADIPNNNGDFFSADELKKSTQTFVGVPFFTNHQNDDVEKAKGKIVFAEWSEEQQAIYVIAFVDRDAYAPLARGIEQEYVTGVSMGCSVEYSTCSICSNQAISQDDYCAHIRNLKGRKFTGRATDVKTGQTRDYKEAAVYEDNFGIRFIELSGVVDPACPSCQIGAIYNNEDFTKAASSICNFSNKLMVFASSDTFKKEASEQDIERLNEVLSTLEDIAIKLIGQRENIEMQFSSDLVSILADLQEYVDALVQAGFGRLPDEIPGNVPDEAADPRMPGAEGMGDAGLPPLPAAGVGGLPGDRPISDQQSLGGAGEVSGADGSPLAAAPSAPGKFKDKTRPSPSMGLGGVKKPVSPRSKGASTIEENTNMRRTPANNMKEREKITSALETNWQEKVEKISNTMKESLAGEVTLSDKNIEQVGGRDMSNIIEAKAKQTPLAVTEKQLSDGVKHHPREGDVREDVIGKQLADFHEGNPNEIEQGLLESVRTDDAPNTVGQNQLEPTREGDAVEQTTQAQLETERTNNEPNTIIEDLLSHPKVDTPSTRWASHQDHIKAAVDVIAKTVVSSQSTPSKVIKTAGSFALLSLDNQASLVNDISVYSGEVPAVDNFNERVAYWAQKGVTASSATDPQIKQMIIAFAANASKTQKLNPDMLLKAFAVVKANDHSDAIVSGRVEEIIESGEVVEASLEDDMNSELDSMITEASDCCEKCENEECKECVTCESAGCECACKKASGFCFKCKDKECKECTDCESAGCECSCSDDKEASVKEDVDILTAALERKAVKTSSHIIETSFKEIGVPEASRGNDNIVKAAASCFAHGAFAHLGVKVAAVVNVTVDGDTGDVIIAVDTEGGSVETPVENEGAIEEPIELADGLADEGPMPEDAAPLGDFGEGGPETPELSTGLGAFTSTKGEKKVAQFGGGDPGAGSGGALPDESGGGVDPSIGLTPDTVPEEGAGLQSFTDEEELPGDDEQMEPGTICPVCGSTDTETGNKDQQPGQFDCNSCGIKYLYHVNIELLNPESVAEDDESELDLEAPSAPEMPVAAMIDIDRGSMKKIADMQKEVGHICPACGSGEVQVQGHPSELTIACSKCKTETEKTMMINVDSPTESKLQIAWSIDPMKRKCGSCKQEAKKFAATMVFDKMMKRAATVDLPKDRLAGWVANTYPEIELVTTGPYKGQDFSETIVSQASRFGFTKIAHIQALADAQSAEDPMEKCVRDQKKRGYTVAESSKLCDCLKEKFAGEEDNNIYIAALSSQIDTGILRKMAEYDKSLAPDGTVAEASKVIATVFDLPEFVETEVSADVEALTAGLQEEVALFTESELQKEAGEFDNPPPVVDKGSDGVTKTKEQKNTEKKVDNVDSISENPNEEPSASRSKMGDEDTEAPADPDVPRGNATIGKEEAAPAEGVSVPIENSETNSSALKNQAEATSQGEGMEKVAYGEIEPMTRNDNAEHVHPDSTTGDNALQEKPCTEKKVEVVESIEGHDNVVRNPNATINDEQALTEGGPDIPRSDATMGNESPPVTIEPVVPSEDSGTDTTMRGREAEREKQLEKISSARREHAARFAGQLVERGIIKEAEVSDFVNDLSVMPLDRMKAHVDRLLLPQKKASTTKTAATSLPMLTSAIIEEPTFQANDETDVSIESQLADMFTIGSQQQNRAIRMDMADRESEDKTYNF